jgi:Ca2+/Na+ antiporter
MSKRKKEHKQGQIALADARKITPGKMLRLLLKSLLFSLLVVLLMVGLNFVGIPAFQNFWIQLLVMVVVYAVAYPYLMREFRPQRSAQKK